MTNRIAAAVLVFCLFLAACNSFHKIEKETDLNKKYDAAIQYYNKGDYVKAQLLFDELYAVIRTSDKAENVAYLLAYCNYKLGDYVLAAYEFRSFFRTFPTSPKAAECLYMSAYCHFLISPPYTLDQDDTYSAIDEFQYFIQVFPTDTARIHECNKMIDKLHAKLETKAFMNAKTYYDIGDYKAAVTAFDVVLHDYPDTHYREEIAFLKFKSKYLLAVNSIDAKKADRIADAISDFNAFTTQFPESEYTGQAKDIYHKALIMQQKITNDQKTKTNAINIH